VHRERPNGLISGLGVTSDYATKENEPCLTFQRMQFIDLGSGMRVLLWPQIPRGGCNVGVSHHLLNGAEIQIRPQQLRAVRGTEFVQKPSLALFPALAFLAATIIEPCILPVS